MKKLTTLKSQFAVIKNEKGEILPYVLGWFLGVPISVLLLIAMLRTVF